MSKEITFQPYGHWVLLPNPTKRVTESGIILDEKTAGALVTNVLKVSAVGSQCTNTKVGETGNNWDIEIGIGENIYIIYVEIYMDEDNNKSK